MRILFPGGNLFHSCSPSPDRAIFLLRGFDHLGLPLQPLVHPLISWRAESAVPQGATAQHPWLKEAEKEDDIFCLLWILNRPMAISFRPFPIQPY